ncbi:E3 ubiquitin-protein ligase MARCHF6-like isoform X2 [Magallana gigas]|uniref:E3 ubiquitin-protein ligase MARCHF6-like isoform X2 n=1 Tax=Magallana gigas TaxID=29159 RepID=UPI0005C36050|nr:LOW QUALITY PROTEIN: E3 ubiquitin-protein ligase MARCHF6-like [Crassostrea gigas]|eukprot:XP_011417611.1 PREDICTED: E3 ubiquitin-protein ligase MARCH6-like isoform X2 [Crassostrea gigas]
MEESELHTDICRVCRCESTPDKPLYHPCVCTGSIRYIHQDCLVQWLKYSRKEYCELCKHRFAFTPIYSPDMPKRLPIRDIFGGLLSSIGRAVRYWFHYTLVAFAWLGVVPLTACRIYRCLFTGSVSSLLTLPLDMLSTENLASDCFHGCFVVTCTLCAFISLVWLREQILHGGGPDWLEQDNQRRNNNRNPLDGGVVNNLVGLGGRVRPAAANQNEGNNAGDEQPAANEDEQEEDGGEGVEGANNGNNGAQDDNNWNPIEWDRAAEELTWERLLGLDGSLVFLEHVFWVVSLNTLFILVFAFCPYHIGHFTMVGLKMDDMVESTHFEGLLTTMIGYIVISASLIVLYMMCSIAKLRKFRRVLGLCYVVVKVMLLVVIEVGVFPVICGWWLDICSLSMFDATLKDRKNSFHAAPGTSMFIHWLVGMVYVFYFASFILLLREVLRPGVLWFLRNLNDPEFNPIQEMIHLPVYRHARRFLASVVIFGSTVLLMLWLPARVIRKVFASFLPYHVMLSSDAPVSELSLELLLLQVVLPALLEQGHTRMWLKGLIRGWTVGVAYLLGLRSYLLGDTVIQDGDNVVEGEPAVNPQPAAANNPAPPPAGGGLRAAHVAMLQGGGPTGFQSYKRPPLFPFRIVLLVLCLCFTLFFMSLVSLVLPVFVGRKLMSLWMGEAKIHELYTAACGLYVCWVVLRIGTVLYNWIPQGTSVILNKVKEWVFLASKCILVAFLLIGVVPLLLGLLFELVVVAPLRVPLDQTPIFFPWQDWALGVLHAKIVTAVTMMGPQWWLKRVIEQVYNDGIRNINLRFILTKLCAPVIGVLGMSLSVPYVVARSIVPFLGFPFEVENLVLRRIYPFLLACIICVLILIFQIRQFKRLYEHIKNDKYLVGQRLVNYEPHSAANVVPKMPSS